MRQVARARCLLMVHAVVHVVLTPAVVLWPAYKPTPKALASKFSWKFPAYTWVYMVVLMPTVLAVSCTLSWWFCSTVFSAAQYFSLHAALDVLQGQGHHLRRHLEAPGLTFEAFQSWQYSAGQHLTVAYDSASLAYTAVIWVCICWGRDKMSIAAW